MGKAHDSVKLRSEDVAQGDPRNVTKAYDSRVLCANELVRMVKCLLEEGL